MTPAEIIAAVRRRGTTLAELSREHGLRSNALATSLTAHKRRQPKAHKIIASFLGRSLHELWPQWYAPGEQAFARINQGVVDSMLERLARGENFKSLCAEPGQPSECAVYGWRRQHPDQEPLWIAAFGKGRRKHVERDPAVLATYVEAVTAGRPTRELHKLISWKAILRLRESDTGFAVQFAEARRTGVQRAARQATARALSPSEIFAVVEAAVRHVPPQARDDVRSDLIVQLLSGEVTVEGAKAATRQLVTAWNRQYGRRDLSFDQEIGEGGFTFGGLVADPSSYVPSGVRVIKSGLV